MKSLCLGWLLVCAIGAAGPGAQAQDPARNLVVQPAATPPAAAAERRVALVIGNNAYRDAPLTNPVNDARAMADALRAAGFDVVLRTDISHREFLSALREFGDRLRRSGAGLFYFAGHGMQIKGRNYLIPVDAAIEREDEVAYAAVDAQAVLDKMESAGAATNLLILDACRNNPFARSFRSASQGLAQMDAPVGTLVAFATAPGSVASDGQGSNGLYTQHMLEALRRPGLKVEDVFKQTRAAVRRDSQGKQVPWEATSLEGDFYFVPPLAPVAPPATAAETDRAVEEALWSAVKDSREPAELRAYLGRYPQGPHAAQARTRLAALAPAASSAAAAAAALPAAASAAPPSQVARRPADSAATYPPRGNAQGYTVGDKWNYQVIDKWKGEVVRNDAVRVGKIEPDGSWLTAGGAEYDEHGRLRKWQSAAGEWRQCVPHCPRWWPGMKVGETRRFKYDYSGKPADGKPWLISIDGEGRVLGIENVKVPAGEFQAYRVEYKATMTAVGRAGAGTLQANYWYVPEMHTLVAQEEDANWSGRTDRRERRELTSFNLANPPPPSPSPR